MRGSSELAGTDNATMLVCRQVSVQDDNPGIMEKRCAVFIAYFLRYNRFLFGAFTVPVCHAFLLNCAFTVTSAYVFIACVCFFVQEGVKDV